MQDKTGTVIQEKNVLRLNNAESNRLTRECLATALMQLMKEKPIDRITITELVKRSGVSRTAFYRNYSTKEEILQNLCEEITALTNEFISKPEFKENTYLWFKECFKVIKENADVINTILDANLSLNGEMIARSVLDSMYSSDDRMTRYRKRAMAAAFQRILCLWVREGMIESVDEMAEFCHKAFLEQPVVR